MPHKYKNKVPTFGLTEEAVPTLFLWPDDKASAPTSASKQWRATVVNKLDQSRTSDLDSTVVIPFEQFVTEEMDVDPSKKCTTAIVNEPYIIIILYLLKF